MFKFNLVSSLLMTLFMMPSAQANVSWSFNSGSGSCTGSCNYWSNSYSFTSSSNNNVTASAFSTTKDIYVNGNDADAFETAHLAQYSGGLGIRSQEDPSGSPDHAIDNDGNPDESDKGDVDAVLFSFDEKTSLSGVNIGYYQYDSDMTVMAHNGIGDKSLVGKTFAELLSNGWSLIGHYADLSTSSTKAINTNDFFSSDWLITAYTPDAGDSQGWSFGNDFFKLSGLSGDLTVDNPDNTVPEPSSIALFLLGLIGWKMSSNGSRRTIVNAELLAA